MVRRSCFNSHQFMTGKKHPAIKFAAISLFIFVVTPARGQETAGGLYNDVRVIESSDQGLTLEFRPYYMPTDTVGNGSNQFELLTFSHCSSPNHADAGQPDVRFRSIAVGLPGLRNNVVTVQTVDYENVGNVSFAPVPKVRVHKNDVVETEYAPRYSSVSNFYPATIAQFKAVGVVKGMRVGYLGIYPLQYNPMSKTLKKYTRIVVHIDFGNREQITASASDLEWAKISMINFPIAQRWVSNAPALKKIAATNSVLSSGTWFKLEVKADGMYKIDASYLKTLGVDISTIGSIRNIRVFGYDGKKISEDPTTSRPADLPELAVYAYDQNGDGQFEDGDYVLFFGQGVTGWDYNGRSDFSHYSNPYTASNYYFLQIASGGSGRPMANVNVSGSSSVLISQTIGKVFFEEDKVNPLESGQQWLSAPLNSGDSRVIVNKLNGYATPTPVTYKYSLYSRSLGTAAFTIEESGTPVANVNLGLIPSDEFDDNQSPFATGAVQRIVVPSYFSSDGQSNVKISYSANASSGIGWIDYLEILYQQKLSAVNNIIEFTSPDTSGAVEYSLSGFTTNDESIFDISDIENVAKLQVIPVDLAGNCLFRDTLSRGRVKKYWAGTPATYLYPSSFKRMPNSNLHGMDGAEFIIITYHDFVPDAKRLALYRENQNLKTIVVDVDTVYDEFGFGMPDPVALRDFLKYAYNNWAIKPGYVLLFGDASYDYRGILGNDNSWVPTFEVNRILSDSQIENYNSDDFFGLFGNDQTVSLAIGRIAVRNEANAKFIVDRIIQYETNSSTDTWKNLITIVSDDNNVEGQVDGATNEPFAESLAVNDVPPSFEIRKIYTGDYPTTISASGRLHPEARQDIINQVNNGTLMLNYTGHGNPTVWAHESILTQQDVNTQFFNADKLTCVVAATCDWERFDAAGEQSSAEDMMMNPEGGAIAVFGSTRPVYDFSNSQTNETLYDYLLPQTIYASVMRLGDATMLTKNALETGDLTNLRKYHLLGDPTMRLVAPKGAMTIDSINGVSLANGHADTLAALSKVTIAATVRTATGAVADSSNGTALVTVYDAERDRTYTDTGDIFHYILPGGIIYKGENSILKGRMHATCIIPKDISYGKNNARVSVYFSGSGTDGKGYTNNVFIGGSTNIASTDMQGPTIQIYLGSRAFRSGDLVDDNPVLYADLSDSNGINTASSSIGHGLEAWLDNSSTSIDLTDYYTGAKDSYQSGTIQYQLSGLSTGEHTLKIRAWDVYNNSSSADVEFTVASSTALTLENVYNVPNPVRSATTFTFQQNQTGPIEVQIKIYTVSGRLIQTIDNTPSPGNFVEIPWNCRDRDGDKIANGVYFYKITARTVDGKYASEAIGKLSVVR